jgi:outer membrane protein OmpA-like peptidoglycan-associated protein
MNQSIKIFVLFLVALSINSVSFAQQKGKKSTKSVIVMSKAQLDSLLAGIAHRKKAQMAKRQQGQSANNPALNSRISAKAAAQKPEMGQIPPPHKAQKPGNPAQNDARIFRELDRMNQRMDRLMMEMHKTPPQDRNSNYPQGSGTTIVPNPAGHSPNIFYRQERSGVPNQAGRSGNASARDNHKTSPMDTLNAEITNLQNKLGALQRKLQEDSNSANKKEIANLKGHLDTLNTQLEKANKSIESGKQQKTDGNNSPATLLKNYRQTIYFANNSATLNSADKALLLQLAKMAKRSNGQANILVQGYASKAGSALYNYKLSQKRADAVKDVLTSYGISAGKIEARGHGVNKSSNAPAARMVEISLY